MCHKLECLGVKDPFPWWYFPSLIFSALVDMIRRLDSTEHFSISMPSPSLSILSYTWQIRVPRYHWRSFQSFRSLAPNWPCVSFITLLNVTVICYPNSKRGRRSLFSVEKKWQRICDSLYLSRIYQETHFKL